MWWIQGPAAAARPPDDDEALARVVFFPLRVLLHLLGMLWRVIDVVVLLPTPRLLGAYLKTVRLRLKASPYVWPRAYRDVASVKKSGQSLDELVYGEVPLAVGMVLLWMAGVRRGSRVLDIGAGRGRLVLAARRLGAEADGIELVISHVLAVARILESVGARMEAGDGLVSDLTGVDCVFINAAGLKPPTVERLSAHLASLAVGAKVIAVTRPLVHEALVLRRTFLAPFTWGVEYVRIYERTA